jgi:hypothetical protein
MSESLKGGKPEAHTPSKITYWHHELPPLDADPACEYFVEASSAGVPGTLAHRDEL